MEEPEAARAGEEEEKGQEARQAASYFPSPLQRLLFLFGLKWTFLTRENRQYCIENLQDHLVVRVLIFGGTTILPSMVAIPFTPTPAAYKGSLFSPSSPTLLISCLFGDSHPSRGEVIHCGFDLPFPVDEHLSI